jgi:23S rRNA (cytidine1920-2'-O)/16S rRNA (cytidine1409-2'-O)-methyltransferase
MLRAWLQLYRGKKGLPNKQRLDTYMVETGLASGREKAKELILAGTVTVNGKTVIKAAASVAASDHVECTENGFSYVGRGALKLEKAFQQCDVPVCRSIAMDIGASTGGFTQCLLQHGAQKVYAVDVGHDQLHPLLKNDSRVINLEGTDIRSQRLKETVPAASVDIMTADVSFISLRQVLPFALPFLKKGAQLILLIKPQFEAGKAHVGKNGIVRDRSVHVRVLRELADFFISHGCYPRWFAGSPITGGAGRSRGNIEYLTVLVYNDSMEPLTFDFRRIVDETFASFS